MQRMRRVVRRSDVHEWARVVPRRLAAPPERRRGCATLAARHRRARGGRVFDLYVFLAELVASRTDPDRRGAAYEALTWALASPADVTEALAPAAGGLELLHHVPDLTVINIAWAPHMRLMPHDHRMWAVIGIYCGREDNQFFRCTAYGLDPDERQAARNRRRVRARHADDPRGHQPDRLGSLAWSTSTAATS